MIERSLTATNKGVRAGLQVEIRLRAHRLNNVNDSREAETEGLAFLARKCRDLEIFRSDAEDHLFPDKLPRGGTLGGGKRYIDCTAFDLRKSDLLAVLFQSARDEIHRRAAEKAGYEKIYRVIVKGERSVVLLHDPLVHDHDPVAHRHRLDLVVRDVNHRRLEPLVQLGNFRSHLHPHLGVEV